jgi:hypothetical protein
MSHLLFMDATDPRKPTSVPWACGAPSRVTRAMPRHRCSVEYADVERIPRSPLVLEVVRSKVFSSDGPG